MRGYLDAVGRHSRWCQRSDGGDFRRPYPPTHDESGSRCGFAGGVGRGPDWPGSRLSEVKNAINRKRQKIRTARSPPKLSLKPSRLEGRVLQTEYPERVSGLLQDCKYPVNSVSFLDANRSVPLTRVVPGSTPRCYHG